MSHPKRIIIQQSDPGTQENIVSQLNVPADTDFRGFIDQDELATLHSRDKETILAMSKMEQWSTWHTETLIQMNSQLRRLEAEVNRNRGDLTNVKDIQKEHGWRITFGKWLLITLGTAMVSVITRWLLGGKQP